jgi:putative SOS response-associated peptidase YedK
MCYSAQITAHYKKFVRQHGAIMGLKEFTELLLTDTKKKGKSRMPKAMEEWFRDADSPQERDIWALIQAQRQARELELQQEMFKQAKRLADAERSLQAKLTKKAQDDQRIARSKVEKLRGDLADLRRHEPQARDFRFFPGNYAPLLVAENQQLVVYPMRYQCRLPGWTETIERKYPGTYNARRDSLAKSWSLLFGYQHGLLIVDTFYENVQGADGRNQVLQFTPRTGEPMLVPCLWNRSVDPRGEEPDLLSFAAITDEPEPEVAATGHDRTIINLKPEHVQAWLHPDPEQLEEQYRILDDRQHPYYEWQEAA